MSHTHGPWHTSRSSAYVRYTQSDGTHPNICDVGSWSDPDELEANARLIAAAPELLAALKDALIFIDHLCEISTLKTSSVRLLAGYHNIEAAISKAQGFPQTPATADTHAAHGAGLPTGNRQSGSVPHKEAV